MSFLKKLAQIFTVTRAGSPNFYIVRVKCNRCGEVITGKINLLSELSLDYEGGRASYICRKSFMGEKRCFQRVEIFMRFNSSRKVINKEVSGGDFVD